MKIDRTERASGAAAAVVLMALVTGACVAEPEIPDDYGELQVHLDSDPAAPYAAYHVAVLDPRTGEVLVQRTLQLDEVVMPIDSRFVAALPADQLLLVDVIATDSASAQVGAGAAIVSLLPKQTTTIQIEVLARPAGQSGVLGAELSDAQLPHRDYLLADPGENTAGATQVLIGLLKDAETEKPVADAVALQLDAAVAPMFLAEQDGAISASFPWATPQVYPAELRASIAYLDGAGRGWIGGARVTLADGSTPAPVEVGWRGQVHASGVLSSQGRWLLGVDEALGIDQGVIPCDAIVFHDADGDGAFAASEVTRLAYSEAGRVIFWTAPDPVGVVMPIDVAGAIADTDGDGALDTFLALSAEGAVTTTPWPIPE